jgi:two-component system nitrogen regulation sensor histidine kinase NtrY
LIRGDILGMANDIANARPLFDQDRGRFAVADGKRRLAQLAGRMLIDKDRNILETRKPAFSRTSRRRRGFPQAASTKRAADRGLPEANYVRAVIRLRASRHLPLRRPSARSARGRQLSRPRPASPNMPQLESRRLGIQVAFALMFAVIALTILMASVLIGLNFANWLVAPIRA